MIQGQRILELALILLALFLLSFLSNICYVRDVILDKLKSQSSMFIIQGLLCGYKVGSAFRGVFHCIVFTDINISMANSTALSLLSFISSIN
jgi:hypothetical protein